jgi:hypothetical protein
MDVKAKILQRVIKMIGDEIFNVHDPCETYNASLRGNNIVG